MSKHTPGQFFVLPVVECREFLIVAPGVGEWEGQTVAIAIVRSWSGAPPDEEVEANAQLFAAAPELLSLCKEFLLHTSLVEHMSASIVERASAAIRKATEPTP